MLADIRFALRSFRRRPTYTAVVVLTIGLGIGASTSMFSIVNAAIIRPVPVKDPERLAFLWGTAGPQREIRGASIPEVLDWRELARSFEDIAIYDETSLTLSGDGDAARLEAELVSASYFDILGVPVARGRTFHPEEDRTPDSHPVALISHELWTNRFGGDPSTLGRTLTLNGRAYTVVGIMPDGFRGLSFDTEVWIPSMMVSAVASVTAVSDRGWRWLGAVGRIKPNVTFEMAQRDLKDVAARLEQLHPDTNRERGVRLLGLKEAFLGTTQSLLLVLFGAVSFLLLIACANIMGLQVVRAASRDREMSLRVALGADRRRLLQQLLAEGLVLAFAGAALGVLLTVWGMDALLPLVPDGVLPPYVSPRLDARVLMFSALVALVAGVAFGIAPAVRSSRANLTQSLKDASPSTVVGLGTIRRPRLQQLLVIGEVALALMLLISAGLMVRSFREQLSVDPGFRPDGLLAIRVSLPQDRYTRESRATFGERLNEKLSLVPSVRSVAVGTELPLRNASSAGNLAIDGDPARLIRYYRHGVSPDYFSTLGIRLVRGRTFTTLDRAGSPLVAVVGEEMAKRFWPNGDAVGKRVRLGGGDGPWVEIVGVVGTVRFRDLTSDLTASASDPDVYFPFAQRPDDLVEIAIRTDADPASIAPLVRNAVAELDPSLAIHLVQPMTEALAQQTAAARFGSLLLTLFSGLALLLAAVGIYGLLAFVVSLSNREIALRMALGAARNDVLSLVVSRGMTLVIAGIALGLAGAMIATRSLSTLLFRVGKSDPSTFVVVSLLLAAVALVACYVPALRAASVAPQLALKSE